MTKRTESNVVEEKVEKKGLPKDMGPGRENREFTRDFLPASFLHAGKDA